MIFRLLAVALIFSFTATAQIRLPAIVRDSMVLQRDAAVKIWGWASPGEKIAVHFNNEKYKTTADNNGNWQVILKPQKAGGPYNMTIDGKNHVSINSVLLGDVWLCSGQSNMVHQMSLHNIRYAQEIREANDPEIRQFWVPTTTDLIGPQKDLPYGYWKPAVGNDVLPFSAVAYFFAKKIHDTYHVPIGIINSSWGGTPIEAWTSEEGLRNFDDVIKEIEKNKDTAKVREINREARAYNSSVKQPVDEGLASSPKWYEESYTPADWRPVTVPGYWEDQGVRNLNGVVWYRRSFDVSSLDTDTAFLALGRIVDANIAYINGREVGRTGYQYPQRRYYFPSSVLHTGENIITVRIQNNAGKGGFVPDKPYYLVLGSDTIDLSGTWQYKVGSVFVPVSFKPSIAFQNQPTALYNAMIAPFTNYTIKGVCWYQGESNAGNAAEYEDLLHALIGDWRKQFTRPDLPFLFVQLPNFGPVNYSPAESQWAVMRNGMRKTLSVPNTGMAITIDVGEWNDVHPDRKKEVGDRLALAAMPVAYGDKNVVGSGPLIDSARLNGNKAILTFKHKGSGLMTKDGGALKDFAVAGPDRKFVWATAKIQGDKVIVWNDLVANPVFVRYAWADSPDNPNLFNKEGLPASPFEVKL